MTLLVARACTRVTIPLSSTIFPPIFSLLISLLLSISSPRGYPSKQKRRASRPNHDDERGTSVRVRGVWSVMKGGCGKVVGGAVVEGVVVGEVIVGIVEVDESVDVEVVDEDDVVEYSVVIV